jgi:hypothetical protein
MNNALANALLGIKATRASSDVILELISAGLEGFYCFTMIANWGVAWCSRCSAVSSTSAPVIRQQVTSQSKQVFGFENSLIPQLFLFVLEWATDSISRQGKMFKRYLKPQTPNISEKRRGFTLLNFCWPCAQRVSGRDLNSLNPQQINPFNPTHSKQTHILF